MNKHILNFIFCAVLISCNTAQNSNDNVVKKPNILFIVTDDLNCDLGSYNHPLVKSPNIDKLAKNGILFENAHNQFPLCGPSRASFMTSLYTDQTNIKGNNIFVRQALPDVTTLAEKFRQEGYNSVRIGKIYHYSNPGHIGTSSFDDPDSWDYVINPHGRDKKEEHKINGIVDDWGGGDLSWLASEGTDEEQTDGIVASEAIEHLDYYSNNGQNFFLAVGLFRPHVPFVAPKKYFQLYSRDDIIVPPLDDDFLKTIPYPAARSLRAKKEQINLDKEIAKTVIQAYYATNSFVDAQIGRILDKLKKTGLDKNTIVVFTSDHGFHMGEHGHYMKQTLFNSATRVPLIFSGPGIKKGVRIPKSPVELIDIYPTLLDMSGLDIPGFISGKSLVPIFKNPKISVRKSALTNYRKAGYEGYSAKTDRYRITKWGENGEHGYELYDHNKDKNENINLANNPDYKKVKEELVKHLDDRIKNSKISPKGITQIENYRSVSKAKYMRYTPKNGQK